MLTSRQVSSIVQELNIPASYDFGEVLFGASEEKSLLLVNSAERQVDISFVGRGQMTAFPEQVSLGRGEQATIAFTFRPARPGRCEDRVELTVCGVQGPDITGACECTESHVRLEPEDLGAFRETLVTKAESCEVELRNEGERPFDFAVKRFSMPQADGSDPDFSHAEFSIATLRGRVFPEASTRI